MNTLVRFFQIERIGRQPSNIYCRDASWIIDCDLGQCPTGLATGRSLLVTYDLTDNDTLRTKGKSGKAQHK